MLITQSKENQFVISFEINTYSYFILRSYMSVVFLPPPALKFYKSLQSYLPLFKYKLCMPLISQFVVLLNLKLLIAEC